MAVSDLENLIREAQRQRSRPYGNTTIIQRGDRRTRAIPFQEQGLSDRQLAQLLDRQEEESRLERVEQHDQSVMARNLLMEKDRTEKAHVNPWAAQQAERDKRRQRVSDLEFEMFKKWVSNPSNGASMEEINQVSDQIANKAQWDSSINPQVLYKAEDDESNPVNRKARVAESLASMAPDLGYTADQWVSLIPLDANGNPDSAKMLDFIHKQQKAKADSMGAMGKEQETMYKRRMDHLEADYKRLSDNPPEVGEDGVTPEYEEQVASWQAERNRVEVEMARMDKAAFGGGDSMSLASPPSLIPRPDAPKPTASAPASATPAPKAVVFHPSPGPDGSKMPVVTSRADYQALLQSEQLPPNSYFVDELGRLGRVRADGKPELVK